MSATPPAEQKHTRQCRRCKLAGLVCVSVVQALVLRTSWGPLRSCKRWASWVPTPPCQVRTAVLLLALGWNASRMQCFNWSLSLGGMMPSFKRDSQSLLDRSELSFSGHLICCCCCWCC